MLVHQVAVVLLARALTIAPLLGCELLSQLLLDSSLVGCPLLLLLQLLEERLLRVEVLTHHILASLLPILSTVVLRALLVSLVGPLVLFAVEELVADAKVLLYGVDYAAEAVVVAVDFDL